MGRKAKYSKEFKINVTEKYINGEGSSYSIGKEFEIDSRMLQRWAKQYTSYGEDAFEHSLRNASYTKELKEKVVLEYLNNHQSCDDLTIKYNIPLVSTIKKWINNYNSHRELKDYIPQGETIYMTKSRKINKEEHIEIVNYCIEQQLDYKKTVKVYEATYTNVFN